MSLYSPPRTDGRTDSGRGLARWWPFALAAVIAVGVLVVFVVSFSLGRGSIEAAPSIGGVKDPVGVSGPAQDAIADAPFPYPVAGPMPEPMTLPASTSTTALAVPTGFPRTPEGAVAQLAAYAKAMVQASPDLARQINAEWVIPGGPGGNDSASFLDQKTQVGSTLTMVYTPVQGQVRGVSAGGDFVQACVMASTVATYTPTGDVTAISTPGCSRMWWIDGRWMVENKGSEGFSEGTAPTPGSQFTYQTGWSDLR